MIFWIQSVNLSLITHKCSYVIQDTVVTLKFYYSWRSVYMEYMCHKWPWICSTNSKRFQVLSHSWFFIGFVTRAIRRVALVEQELLTLPEHLSAPPVSSGIRVTRSLVLCAIFCRSLFVPMSSFCWLLCCLKIRIKVYYNITIASWRPIKEKKSHTVGTIPKKINIVERCKIDKPRTQIHDQSLWFQKVNYLIDWLIDWLMFDINWAFALEMFITKTSVQAIHLHAR